MKHNSREDLRRYGKSVPLIVLEHELEIAERIFTDLSIPFFCLLHHRYDPPYPRIYVPEVVDILLYNIQYIIGKLSPNDWGNTTLAMKMFAHTDDLEMFMTLHPGEISDKDRKRYRNALANYREWKDAFDNDFTVKATPV